MKRKVIQLAGKTLVVSLPIIWVKKYGVKKGDEVDIKEEEGGLKIDTKSRPDLKRISIHLKKGEKLFKRYIVIAYNQGYDEVEVTSDTSLSIEEIRKNLDKLLGFEIIEQSEKRCVIKTITETLENQFDSILRRVFLLNKAMGLDLYEALKSKKIEGLNDIALIENTNNKFTNFCFRAINKSSYIPKEKNTYLCLTIDGLEKIADYYRDICYAVNKNNVNKMNNKVIEFLKEINEFYDLYYSLFYNFKKEGAAMLREKRNKLMNKGKDLVKELKGEQMLIITQLMRILSVLHHLMILLSPITS